MKHPVWTVFDKEMRDGRRDRRAVVSALMFPLLGPVLVYFMMTSIIHIRTEASTTEVPIKGMDNAPGLVQWLREHDVRIEAFKGDPRAAVKARDKELVLVIPDDYQSRFGEAKPALVELVHDGSRTDSRATVSRLQRLVNHYNSQMAGLRLVVRGVAPSIMRVVDVQEIDVASKQQRAAAALNFIPMYIMLAAFISGMGLAIDSTAGERERKSLEALLINPVERFHIVTGKWLAASVFASVGMSLTAVLCIAAMLQVQLQELGLSFSVTPLQMGAIIFATFPLGFLATALQLFLGMFAKSFKDAQSYMGLLVILPVVPSMFTLFNPIATQSWMYAVPMLGQQLLLVDLIGGKSIPVLAYFYSAASCLVLGFAVVLWTARLFQRESIITS